VAVGGALDKCSTVHCQPGAGKRVVKNSTEAWTAVEGAGCESGMMRKRTRRTGMIKTKELHLLCDYSHWMG